MTICVYIYSPYIHMYRYVQCTHLKTPIPPDVLSFFEWPPLCLWGKFFLASSEKRGDQALGNGGRTCLSHKIHLVGPFHFCRVDGKQNNHAVSCIMYHRNHLAESHTRRIDGWAWWFTSLATPKYAKDSYLLISPKIVKPPVFTTVFFQFWSL